MSLKKLAKYQIAFACKEFESFRDSNNIHGMTISAPATLSAEEKEKFFIVVQKQIQKILKIKVFQGNGSKSGDSIFIPHDIALQLVLKIKQKDWISEDISDKEWLADDLSDDSDDDDCQYDSSDSDDEESIQTEIIRLRKKLAGITENKKALKEENGRLHQELNIKLEDWKSSQPRNQTHKFFSDISELSISDANENNNGNSNSI